VLATRRLTDKADILEFLQRDEVYAAYAIGDLEPQMFTRSDWAGAEVDGRLCALILHFRGMAIPALFLMGDACGLRAILADDLRPERVYLTLRDEHRGVAGEFYNWETLTPMWRMVLWPARFQPAEIRKCVRLYENDAGALERLYARGGADAFSPSQLEQGVFYGIFTDGQLVAAAGTHLVGPTYGVAAVGNVFVHPDYRRRGYASGATSAVIAELLQNGAQFVILNVAQDNGAAVRVYERLGFEQYCPFLECVARAAAGLAASP
jgi:ribosomal protein S18 acetylase RimI-like enzyme